MTPDLTSVPPEISLTMTTCSRAHLLPHALHSLLHQSVLGHMAVEMVIVDDRSTDQTLEVLEDFKANAPVPVTILHGARAGVAAARNLAAQHARGRWIASFDDDEVAPPSWLETLYRVAKQNDAVCVGGTTELLLPPGWELGKIGPRARRILGEILFKEERRMTFQELPSTNNVLLRKDVFVALGGFNTAFTEGGEDTNFFQRMYQAGHRMWLAPTAKVQHLIPPRRLEPHQLRMSAMRTGAIEARLAGSRKGVGTLLQKLLLRSGLAVLRDLPQWILGKLQNQPAKSFDAVLSLAVTIGLYRGFPAALGYSSRFLEEMDFRSRHGERPETSQGK